MHIESWLSVTEFLFLRLFHRRQSKRWCLVFRGDSFVWVPVTPWLHFPGE